MYPHPQLTRTVCCVQLSINVLGTDVSFWHLHERGVDWLFVRNSSFQRSGGLYGDQHGTYGDNQVGRLPGTIIELPLLSWPAQLLLAAAFAQVASAACPMMLCIELHVTALLRREGLPPVDQQLSGMHSRAACTGCISMLEQHAWPLLLFTVIHQQQQVCMLRHAFTVLSTHS